MAMFQSYGYTPAVRCEGRVESSFELPPPTGVVADWAAILWKLTIPQKHGGGESTYARSFLRRFMNQIPVCGLREMLLAEISNRSLWMRRYGFACTTALTVRNASVEKAWKINSAGLTLSGASSIRLEDIEKFIQKPLLTLCKICLKSLIASR